MMRLLSALLVCLSCQATTYYIAASGSDANNGTAKETPLAHLRGMTGCASTCAAITPTAGDSFIFKGGDTWDNTNFPILWPWSGTSENRIYIGVDQTWYTGASWTRPIFTAGGTQISGTYNMFLKFDYDGVQYVTIDGIEMTGVYWSGAQTYGRLAYISALVAQNITFNNLYFHGWSHGTVEDGTEDDLSLIIGDTNSPYCSGCVFQNGLVDGSDTTGGGDSSMAFRAIPSLINSVIHDVPNGILYSNQATGYSQISGNVFYNIHYSFSGVHPNAIEAAAGVGTNYIFNNVVYDSVGECAFLGLAGHVTYFFNNLVYNTIGNTVNIEGGEAHASTKLYLWNNTIHKNANNYCFQYGHTGTIDTLDIRNNHCITTGASATQPTLSATNLTIDSNLLQTPTNAATDGYSVGSLFAPTIATGATIGAGVNLSSLDIAALNSDKNGVARGSTWDIGAYEYAAPPPTTTFRGVLRGGSLK